MQESRRPPHPPEVGTAPPRCALRRIGLARRSAALPCRRTLPRSSAPHGVSRDTLDPARTRRPGSLAQPSPGTSAPPRGSRAPRHSRIRIGMPERVAARRRRSSPATDPTRKGSDRRYTGHRLHRPRELEAASRARPPPADDFAATKIPLTADHPQRVPMFGRQRKQCSRIRLFMSGLRGMWYFRELARMELMSGGRTPRGRFCQLELQQPHQVLQTLLQGNRLDQALAFRHGEGQLADHPIDQGRQR